MYSGGEDGAVFNVNVILVIILVMYACFFIMIFDKLHSFQLNHAVSLFAKYFMSQFVIAGVESR